MAPLLRSLLLLSIAAALPTGLTGQPADRPITLDYDFRTGAHGWTAVFADYPVGQESFYELEAGIRPLPAELGVAGTGFLLSGNNHSDDLLMALKRRVGAAEGLVAGRTYWLDVVVELASNAQTGCLGTGGSPGEGVYIKVGGSPLEPVASLSAQDGHLRLSVNVGNQSLEGPAATLAGLAANGVPCGSEPARYRDVTRARRHRFPVTADASGNLWLLVLSDSAFESTTRLYYRRISVTLTPVEMGGSTRLANLSSRAETSDTAGPLLAGFYLEGIIPRPILIRGAGPALASFGVADFLVDPVLELMDAGGRRIAFNDDWADAPDQPGLRSAIARTGAFAFAEGSKDAALLATLPPGLYTAILRGPAGAGGMSLVEVYDAGTGAEAARLVNLSTRAWVAGGEGTLFPGLVVAGPNPEKFLLRAIGPGLAKFGIVDFLPDPLLQLYAGADVWAENDQWDALADGALTAAAAQATGAFALDPGSRDAALLVTLAPGAYTMHVTDAGSRPGVALVEVYRVP